MGQATNQAIYMPPGQSSQGALPPPGDGMTAAPVTPGDSQTQNVPSGRISSTPLYGTNMQHRGPVRRSRINLMTNGKVVLTIQPDQLTNQQKGAVQGAIPGIIGGAPYQNVSVSEAQLVQIQKILAPYPVTSTSAVPMPDGRQRSQIFTDGVASNRLSQNGTNGIVPMIPVLRDFCRIWFF